MQRSSNNRKLLRNAQRKMEDPLQKHRMQIKDYVICYCLLHNTGIRFGDPY